MASFRFNIYSLPIYCSKRPQDIPIKETKEGRWAHAERHWGPANAQATTLGLAMATA